MKIGCDRIAAILRQDGFITRQTDGGGHPCAFVRPDTRPLLYQQIDVSFSGRESEAVVGYVAASTTKWIRIKGLSVSRLLNEIASDPDRCWSIVRTAKEAKDWEQALTRRGPVAVTELVAEVGPSLLEVTKPAREQALMKSACLNPEEVISSQIARLYRTMPEESIAAAERLARWNGVMQVANSEDVYLLACLAVMKPREFPIATGGDPLADQKLMWLIQLVADGIFSWDQT
jgi:hypothetical protein